MAPSPPSTLTWPLPPPTTTLPRPPVATTPPLVPLCTDVRSARLRSPSPWSPATHTPPTSVVSSATSPPLLPPSLLTPTVPLCLPSPLTLLRLVLLTSPLLPRLAGRSVRRRCPSTSSPATLPLPTSPPLPSASSATILPLPPSPPHSLLTPTEPSSPRSPLRLLRLVRLTSPLLLRLAGRSVKLRSLSTSSPALPPPLTSTPSSATTWLLLPSPPPSPPTPTEPSSPRSPPMLPRLVLPTSRLWPPPASRERVI